MHHHRQLILIYLNFLQFIVYLSASKHPNHLKPFGTSGPFDKIDELTKNFPDPITFFNEYVSKSRPVVFRQVLTNDLHPSLWDTDEKLNEIFLNNNDIVHIETRKKESRKQDILSMTMNEFLKRYQNEELYLVEEVPNLLRPYFTLPKCLQCKPALETFQVAMLWFSSGNTSSVIHTDDYDNINCVLQGDKQFILVDSNKYTEVADEIIDHYAGSYSSIDVDRVDFTKYPSLDNDIHYYQVNLTKGDCLFIPALWIHQVRSDYRNIAVNYWLNHERAKSAVVDANTCALADKSNFLTLETVQWPKAALDLEDLKRFMMELVDDDFTDFKEWTREFSSELNFELQSSVQTITLFAEFFNMIDLNEDGLITSNEIEKLFDSNNVQNALGVFQNLLELTDDKSDDTVSKEYRMNKKSSGDENDSEYDHEDL